VLPDRVLWLLDDASELEAMMRSFRRDASEYAEVRGAPAGRVWQRGFWYRPLGGVEAVAERAREIARAPEQAGLRARHASWPDGLSGLPEHQKTVSWHASRSAEGPFLWEVEVFLSPH
jgi:hypothetical protein